jgi:hypothetical protein
VLPELAQAGQARARVQRFDVVDEFSDDVTSETVSAATSSAAE